MASSVKLDDRDPSIIYVAGDWYLGGGPNEYLGYVPIVVFLHIYIIWAYLSVLHTER